MSGAIGPGSIVQAVRSNPRHGIAEGSIYRVSRLRSGWNAACAVCAEDRGWIELFDKPPHIPDPLEGGAWVLCPCGFRPWPPEPPAELLSEQEPAGEREVAQ